MKIIFKKIRYKNFFSSGNTFTEIDLLASPKTVIHGKNGDGKSTLFSAIVFALFGKTIKNVNKPNIVNSINKKDCVTEIEFTKGSDEYRVCRGIKPNVFEIYVNGSLLEQTAINDYQEYLETKILKTNYRTFLQTTIISIENYTPFMSLTAAQRREFVENILDITVFTTMNQILKSKLATCKESLKIVDVELKSAREKVLMLKEHIEELQAHKESSVALFDSREKEYLLCIEKENERIASLTIEQNRITEEMKSLNSDSTQIAKLRDRMLSIKKSQEIIEKNTSFFSNNNECPTCKQGIDSNHKDSIIYENNCEYHTLSSELEPLVLQVKQLMADAEIVAKKSSELQAIAHQISSASRSIQTINQSLSNNRSEKVNFENDTSKIDEKKNQMKKLASDAISTQNKKASLNEEKTYLEAAQELLKDSGIKSKIVKQYIPLINKYLNHYLSLMEFFVLFELDEEFNETIKSRHRDIFTYDNFSAGEKQRIDLSCLFTMRKISKAKNSFDSNLMLFDEILDSSLDSVGTDLFLDILDTDEFSGSNIFIISHKNADKLADRFGSSILFKKEGNFSIGVRS